MQDNLLCKNHSYPIKEGFSYRVFSAGEISEEDIFRDTIIFVMKGSIKLTYHEKQLVIPAGRMYLFPRSHSCKYEIIEEGNLIALYFERVKDSCEKQFYKELIPLKKEVSLRARRSHKINETLETFLLTLTPQLLTKGAKCACFHNFKTRELSWILRNYYEKEELAELLSPLIGTTFEFRNLVISNQSKAKTVKELATLCGLSLSAFKRQFAEEFDESPGKWMKKQMDEKIRYKLADDELSIGEIADELEFSSLSQFSRYCKNLLGVTPNEWREKKNKEKILNSKNR